MSSKAEQIIAAAMELDPAERQAVIAELMRLDERRPDQEVFDAACVALANHREALMKADPSRRRTLEQVLEAVKSRVQP